MIALKPIIGITAERGVDARGRVHLGQSETYVAAVTRAGGAPVLLPPLADEDTARALARALDGLLLSGGEDVDPARFGEAPHPDLGSVDPDRDLTEIALIDEARRRGLPIFAICRGIQVLNVAFGGTLVQDLRAQRPGAIQHAQKGPRWHLGHTVEIRPGTRLAGLLGEGVRGVNSFHHQAVERVGEGLVVAATAPDGVVEAVEAPGGAWILGVQWHPEGLVDRHPQFMALFEAFVAAAAARARENAVRAGAAEAAR
ncbi:MAG: gamma-glutamyl-gamma-aminobutyrate hydrolase family protein [Firmicutes bacterium]|nr:gamma-glutamyl-gamma-aminobutyrate hydrolase family protein [Bacillota bacterium]